MSQNNNVQFKQEYEFYHDLGMRESSGDHEAVEANNKNFLGLYQMGKKALIDTDYFKVKGAKDTDANYDAKWKGTWTGKHGINSRQDFLANREVQEIAVRCYHHKQASYLKAYLKEKKYEGEYLNKEFNGVKLTKASLVAGMHLVGHQKIGEYITSSGSKVAQDQNGTKCTDYMKLFSDPRYDIIDMDYKTRQKEYEQKLFQQQIQLLSAEQQEQLLTAAKYYKKLKELDERLQKLFQKFYADNIETAQQEADKLHKQLNTELQNYQNELSVAFEQKNQELYAKYSNELAQLTQARIAAIQAIGDKHTIITNHDLAQQKQQEYNNAFENLKKEQEGLVNAKAKELVEKEENAMAQIIQNIARESSKQKSVIEDYLGDIDDKLKSGENIELVINELNSFMQQFEDTPTA